MPCRIADAALLFEPWLGSSHMLAIMVKFMARAVYTRRTGANLDDEVTTAIKRAALLRNHTLMQVGFRRLWAALHVAPPTDPACLSPPHGTQGCATDGIQADHSFQCGLIFSCWSLTGRVCATSCMVLMMRAACASW